MQIQTLDANSFLSLVLVFIQADLKDFKRTWLTDLKVSLLLHEIQF